MIYSYFYNFIAGTASKVKGYVPDGIAVVNLRGRDGSRRRLGGAGLRGRLPAFDATRGSATRSTGSRSASSRSCC